MTLGGHCVTAACPCWAAEGLTAAVVHRDFILGAFSLAETHSLSPTVGENPLQVEQDVSWTVTWTAGSRSTKCNGKVQGYVQSGFLRHLSVAIVVSRNFILILASLIKPAVFAVIIFVLLKWCFFDFGLCCLGFFCI